MGNLRDQLRKANLVSKKDARRLAHEERVHRKAVGGAGGVDAERAVRQEELRQQQDASRDADRVAQARAQSESEAVVELAACAELLRRESRKPGRKGASQWHFRLPDGRLPWLSLPLTERMQLEDGSLCIVRVGPAGAHDYRLLNSVHGRRVVRVMADRVVWGAPGAFA